MHFLVMIRLREDKRVREMARVGDAQSSKKQLLTRQHAPGDLLKVTAWNRYLFSRHYSRDRGFPGGVMVKNLPAKAGNVGLTLGSGRSPGERSGNPLQCSHLENPMDRRAWQAAVDGSAK